MNNQVAQREQTANLSRVEQQELWVSPVTDVYETKEAYCIQAEMPGVNKAGLEITVADNELTITGRRQDQCAKGNSLHREIRFANYKRVFELDPAIDSQKISARMDQGVLLLTLPKVEKTQPRRISIEG